MRQMNKSKKQKTLKESIKNFIRGRWFPLIVGIICLVLVAFVMSVFGWRITYAPKLENSWSAISAFADWVGVFVSVIGVISSFVAIWYAIQVPKEIADRQDKIALFEKRFEVYDKLQKCKNFADNLKKIDSSDKKVIGLLYFANVYDYADALDYNKSLKILSTSRHVFELFNQSRFLYSKNISEYLFETGNVLKEFMEDVADNSPDSNISTVQKKDAFLGQFEDRYFEIIERMRMELNLSK